MFNSEEDKRKYIQEYNDEIRTLRGASQAEIALYRELVEEGCSKMWTEALVAKAYSCYGGDEAYECDWFMSRDILLQLIEMNGDANPFHYNTLGYIYYYGRCTDGEPDYDAAFKYFSVGAANGIYESKYKLADMFIKGLGVCKSEKAAANLVTEIYDENYDFFCKGIYACKFADIALRMGSMYENGTGVEKDIDKALHYYMQAQYAINLRVANHDYYGDRKVKRMIDESVLRVRSKLPHDYFTDYVDFAVPVPLIILMDDAVGLDVELSFVGERGYITAKRFAPEEDSSSKMLITVPNVGYCELTDRVELEIIDADDEESLTPDFKCFITKIAYDEDEDKWGLWFKNRVMISFHGEAFRFRRK